MLRNMKVTLNGFHGCQTRTCRVKIRDNPEFIADPRNRFHHSQSVKFLGSITESACKKFACRMSDCNCGEGIDSNEEFGLDDVDLKFRTVQVLGNYPQ